MLSYAGIILFRYEGWKSFPSQRNAPLAVGVYYSIVQADVKRYLFLAQILLREMCFQSGSEGWMVL